MAAKEKKPELSKEEKEELKEREKELKEEEKKRKQREKELKKRKEREQKRVSSIINFPFKTLTQVSLLAGLIFFTINFFKNSNDILNAMFYAFIAFVVCYIGGGIVMILVFVIISEEKKKALEEKKLQEELLQKEEVKKREEELSKLMELEKQGFDDTIGELNPPGEPQGAVKQESQTADEMAAKADNGTAGMENIFNSENISEGDSTSEENRIINEEIMKENPEISEDQEISNGTNEQEK